MDIMPEDADGPGEALTDELKRALDETRRVLYMALLAKRAGSHAAIAGTLVNALLHHAVPGLDLSALGFDGVSRSVVSTIAGTDTTWATALIDGITSCYDAQAPDEPGAI
jgi:hypothetical protein